VLAGHPDQWRELVDDPSFVRVAAASARRAGLSYGS
jgi:hypothetical protein